MIHCKDSIIIFELSRSEEAISRKWTKGENIALEAIFDSGLYNLVLLLTKQTTITRMRVERQDCYFRSHNTEILLH
mgnify:CR=1 FL=1